MTTPFDVNFALDISKGQLILVDTNCGTNYVSAYLRFDDEPLIPGVRALHAHVDAPNCQCCALFSYVRGYAILAVDLTPYRGQKVVLAEIDAYAYYIRQPIPTIPTGMRLNVWGPSGVGTDWLNGSDSLFYTRVEPDTMANSHWFSFTPNLDLTGLDRIFIAVALDTDETFPDTHDAYIAPVALRITVTPPGPVPSRVPVTPYTIYPSGYQIYGVLKRVGDVDANGVVDIVDLAFVSAAFEQVRMLNAPNYNIEMDMNLDGHIDILDVATVTLYFDKPKIQVSSLDGQLIVIQQLLNGVWQDVASATTGPGSETIVLNGVAHTISGHGFFALFLPASAVLASNLRAVFHGNTEMQASATPFNLSPFF